MSANLGKIGEKNDKISDDCDKISDYFSQK